jgi:hypothetical protein
MVALSRFCIARGSSDLLESTPHQIKVVRSPLERINEGITVVAHDFTKRLWPRIGRHYMDNIGDDLRDVEIGIMIMPKEDFHRLSGTSDRV